MKVCRRWGDTEAEYRLYTTKTLSITYGPVDYCVRVYAEEFTGNTLADIPKNCT